MAAEIVRSRTRKVGLALALRQAAPPKHRRLDFWRTLWGVLANGQDVKPKALAMASLTPKTRAGVAVCAGHELLNGFLFDKLVISRCYLLPHHCGASLGFAGADICGLPSRGRRQHAVQTWTGRRTPAALSPGLAGGGGCLKKVKRRSPRRAEVCLPARLTNV